MEFDLASDLAIAIYSAVVFGLIIFLFRPRERFEMMVNAKKVWSSKKTYTKMRGDVAANQRAFGYRLPTGRVIRLDPDKVVFLAAVSSPEAVEAARKEGVLVSEESGGERGEQQ